MKSSNRKPTLIAFASFTLLAAQSFANNLSQVSSNWLIHLSPSYSVKSEFAKFPLITDEYINSTIPKFHARIVDGVQRTIGPIASGAACVPKMKVEFLKSLGGTASELEAGRDFESQLIHIQVLACLEGVTPKQVANAYVTAEFKLKGADTVTSSQVTGNRTCQTTSVPVLGRSTYCYHESTFKGPEANFVHSYNDFNAEDVDARVYFREMIAATTETKVNGRAGTAFYTDVYVRGGKLSSFFKQFAKSSIEKSQLKSLQKLQEIALKLP